VGVDRRDRRTTYGTVGLRRDENSFAVGDPGDVKYSFYHYVLRDFDGLK